MQRDQRCKIINWKINSWFERKEEEACCLKITFFYCPAMFFCLNLFCFSMSYTSMGTKKLQGRFQIKSLSKRYYLYFYLNPTYSCGSSNFEYTSFCLSLAFYLDHQFEIFYDLIYLCLNRPIVYFKIADILISTFLEQRYIENQR